MSQAPQTLHDMPDDIVALFKAHRVSKSLRRQPKVYTDTSNFTSIDYGDIIHVDDRYFLITAYAVEGRFGVDDQPKQWVPKVTDLVSGQSLILKLVFHETFSVNIGDFVIPCYRNPEKEARILEYTQGHKRFMQGYCVEDEAGNLVRILDVVRGRRLDKVVYREKCSHEEYFYSCLPAILREFLECAQAITFLHQGGFRHGDIRRDHIYVEFETGLFRWIDFDYDFYLPERPFALDVLELGNLLMFLIARGDYRDRDLLDNHSVDEAVFSDICADDFSLLAKNKIVNLKKIFPYIPTELNDICMHFSRKATVWYDTADEFCVDLEKVVSSFS
ncbi:MAG: serine/threonine protein kinase [Desulfobulbaceae bacterium]|uniref:Serine/threonine protein kinase n=1 Tax=Candidatus Desulfatifera sulfidica TaxID=2841691 RepID=A0A8J6NAS8_9BACT|nr:serine/threonine protein kinase [Candidatus Desulfatifera sulfidica]